MIDAAGLLAWAVLGSLLIAIAWQDARTQRIPNLLNAALLLSGLAAAALPGGPGLIAAAAGAMLGAVFLLAVALGFRRLRGREGLGLGDVKFLAGAGAWTGWQGVGPTVFLAASTALLVLGVRRLSGARWAPDTPIAFGGYLCLALAAVRTLQGAGAWP